MRLYSSVVSLLQSLASQDLGCPRRATVYSSASSLHPASSVIRVTLAEDMDRAGLATTSGMEFAMMKVRATVVAGVADVDGAGIADGLGAVAAAVAGRDRPLTGCLAAGVASGAAYTGATP